MIKVCVTGASGFIGSHLCNYLKNKGYWVRAVDWKSPEFGDVVCDEYNWQCDLRFLHSAVAALDGINTVFHLAANMGGAGFVFVGSNDIEIMRDNTLININMLDAACYQGITKILFSSSACCYPTELQQTSDIISLQEDNAYPANPDSEYGWEKLYAERLYQTYARTTNLEVRLPRLHNVYGPCGSWTGGREKLPAAACRKVALVKLSGNPVVDVWGDGTATRSFCYISDCVEMLMRLIQSDFNEPINIGTDQSISVDRVFDIVADIANVKIEKHHISGPEGVKGRNADLTLMRKVLDYEPIVPLEKGLETTYRWVEEQVRKAGLWT